MNAAGLTAETHLKQMEVALVNIEATAANRQIIIDCLDQAISEGGKTIKIGKATNKRSLDANALQAVFITQISNHYGHDVRTVRNELKRDHGVPVLLAAGDDRSKKLAWTLNKIGYHDMSPAQQISVMDMFNVTSIMTTAEHREMLNSVQAYYRDHGLILESNRHG